MAFMRKLFYGNSPVVSVIKLYGPIAANIGGRRNQINIDRFRRVIDRAFDAKNSKAVALDINSGGGSAVQSNLIYSYIKRKKKQTGLPVFAFVEDMALSGGYYIACSADKIICDRNSVVGSIGVRSTTFGLHEAIKKLGIENRTYTKGKHKDLMNPFRPIRENEEQIIAEILEDLYENFKRIVLESRPNIEKTRVEENDLFSGRLWAAERARSLGLVDEVGDRFDFCSKQFGEQVKFRYCNTMLSFFDFASIGGFDHGLTYDTGDAFVEKALSKLDEASRQGYNVKARF